MSPGASDVVSAEASVDTPPLTFKKQEQMEDEKEMKEMIVKARDNDT